MECKMNIPNDTLPRTSYERKIVNFDKNGGMGDPDTHIFHKYIVANLDQAISISRMYQP